MSLYIHRSEQNTLVTFMLILLIWVMVYVLLLLLI